MSLSQRWQEVRTGFAPPFWIANGTELFERLAYYGLQAVLAIYLHERLRFSEEQTGLLQGVFGFVVWFLPIFGGALADRFGYRRILSLAYLVLSARATSCSARSPRAGWRRCARRSRCTGSCS